MKRDLRDESFEDFLKRSADNLRMKAPDKVWENLSKHLNRKQRRFGAGLSAFLLFTGLLGYLAISTSTKHNFVATRPQPAQAQTGISLNSAVQNGDATQNNAVKKSYTSKERTGIAQTSISFLQSKPIRVVKVGEAENLPVSSGIDKSNIKESGDAVAENNFSPTVVDDSYDPVNQTSPEQAQKSKPSFLMSHDAMPWSIESVINIYKPKIRRFQTEFHFTPTISYRKLSENKSYLRTASIFNTPVNYAALYGSVNNMVTHKPDLGFEVGVAEKYSLSKKVRLRAGLQFNVNRYDIKAFNAPYSLAAIALNNRVSSRIDSVWTISNYSNVATAGKKISWLQNFSFQVSAPVGVELALAGNEKVQFGIGSTVQPTYVLGDRAYLITTNYKNYTQVPWLLRRWNVNTSFETFVAYQSGKTRWQIGPQVRYQLLSSFVSNYPVKEYLFDFGLKVGVSVIK